MAEIPVLGKPKDDSPALDLNNPDKSIATLEAIIVSMEANQRSVAGAKPQFVAGNMQVTSLPTSQYMAMLDQTIALADFTKKCILVNVAVWTGSKDRLREFVGFVKAMDPTLEIANAAGAKFTPAKMLEADAVLADAFRQLLAKAYAGQPLFDKKPETEVKKPA